MLTTYRLVAHATLRPDLGMVELLFLLLQSIRGQLDTWLSHDRVRSELVAVYYHRLLQSTRQLRCHGHQFSVWRSLPCRLPDHLKSSVWDLGRILCCVCKICPGHCLLCNQALRGVVLRCHHADCW